MRFIREDWFTIPIHILSIFSHLLSKYKEISAKVGIG